MTFTLSYSHSFNEVEAISYHARASCSTVVTALWGRARKFWCTASVQIFINRTSIRENKKRTVNKIYFLPSSLVFLFVTTIFFQNCISAIILSSSHTFMSSETRGCFYSVHNGVLLIAFRFPHIVKTMSIVGNSIEWFMKNIDIEIKDKM